MSEALETMPKATYDLGFMIALNLPKAGLGPDVVEFYKNHPDKIQAALRRGFTAQTESMVTEQKKTIPDFSGAGETFGDWLTACELLHEFDTGEKISLRDMFVIPDELLSRTDIMPVFRPAGASNRDAVNRKKKLGIVVWEETDVMKYKNSKGPKVPELYFISRSARPDENTLGSEAKCPDDLLKIKVADNQRWLNLYGYATADDLHFLITGEHLDPQETLTWFPEDRLSDGHVVHGRWRADDGRVRFDWYGPQYCDPGIGARLATRLPLKTS
jgi:hypothetical protein